MHWLVSDPSDLEGVAEALISQFPHGGAIGFEGPLGVGKTTLIKALAKAICSRTGTVLPRVTSPSFVIYQLYETKPPIHHFDFYRLDLKGPDSLLEIGYWEAWESARDHQAFLLVEWPSHSGHLDLKLSAQIQMNFEGEKRRIDLKLLP